MAARESAAGVPVEELAPRVRVALAQLADAHRYAQDAHRDAWDFAVEIAALHALGLTPSDLRWLVCKGHVEHAREVTQPGENGRAFRPTGNLTFSNRSSFILTDAGESLACNVCASSPDSLGPQARQANSDGKEHGARRIPEWDPERHELRVGGRLVKQFKLPSPNQETILMVFQEEGWPAVIDDPLPPQPEQDPKRRLHDTVKSLNRNQRNRLIHFMGNGTGEGVRWEWIEPRPSAGPE